MRESFCETAILQGAPLRQGISAVRPIAARRRSWRPLDIDASHKNNAASVLIQADGYLRHVDCKVRGLVHSSAHTTGIKLTLCPGIWTWPLGVGRCSPPGIYDLRWSLAFGRHFRLKLGLQPMTRHSNQYIRLERRKLGNTNSEVLNLL